MEENRIPKRELYMNLGTTRMRGRPRNRRQDKVREDGRIAGAEGWQEKVRNREERKKLLRTARNRRILHMTQGLINEQLTNFNVYWTVHHCNSLGMKNQLDVTCYFISLIMRSTCFGH